MSVIKKIIESTTPEETEEDLEAIIFWAADWKGVNLSAEEKEKIRKAIKEIKEREAYDKRKGTILDGGAVENRGEGNPV